MSISNMIYSWYEKNLKYAQIVGGLLLVALVGYGSYWWYQRSLEKQAYQAFSESVEDYLKLLARDQDPQVWADISSALNIRAQRYKSSVLAPYFLSYEADALLQSGNLSAALGKMNEALQKLSKKSPLYYLYAIKLALMKLDSPEEAVQKDGLLTLEQLANDNQNPQQEMALYYRGLQEWVAGNTQEAQKIWMKLFTPGKAVSIWAQRAQATTQGIV